MGAEMKVLVACEFSGIVRDAFIARGHDAWSCDLLPTEKEGPHIQGDVLKHIDDGWDLMIAHPPCTHLSSSGAAWFHKKEKEQKEAVEFVWELMEAPIGKMCIENPVGVLSTKIRKPDQIIQPWMFGSPFQKTTCLWLKGLKRLIPKYYDAPIFNMNIDKGEFIIYDSGRKMPKWYAELRGRGKERSITFQGIANAMAEQWG
jgi:hypothetical protein